MYIDNAIKKVIIKSKKMTMSLFNFFRNKKNEPIPTWLTGIATVLTVVIMFRSFIATLNMSKEQLKQSERLYELQNRPIVLINHAGWYPVQVLSGDVGLRIRVHVSNYGKIPTSEAKVIKDIVLRVSTDTLTRFPFFIEDVNKINERLDPTKEKRIVERYLPYRMKPFNDISEYVLEKKGDVTSEDIIKHFSDKYKVQGYSFIPYADLSYKKYIIIPPGDMDLETGRSVSVANFENEILKDGGDILLFYYAIEYTGPLKINKYVVNYIGCYDSFQGANLKDKDGKYLFSYQKYFSDEFEIGKK